MEAHEISSIHSIHNVKCIKTFGLKYLKRILELMGGFLELREIGVRF
jgi:hypothetical protein